MRIFLLSLLALSLPTLGATLGGSRTSVSVEVNRGCRGAEGSSASPDTIKAVSWASFLSPSYILEGIQNVYSPPALRMTGAVQALVEPKPSPSEFWEMAKKLEKKVREYVYRLLEAVATYFKSTIFTDITSAMNHVVGATATFCDNIKDVPDAHHVTFDTLTEDLEGIFMAIVNDLEKTSPLDKVPGHAERGETVVKVLDHAAQALVKLGTRYGIKEKVVMAYLLAAIMKRNTTVPLKPQVEVLIIAIGDINEQHPQLLPALAFSVVTLFIPESWILRPFLSIFGFGPAGPIKGSAAAWMQRRFGGAGVEAGSWFSWLQAAGMGVLPKWAGLIAKTPFLIGGILAMFLPCLNRG